MEQQDGSKPVESVTLRLRRGALIFYYVSFIAIAVLTIIGLMVGDMGDALVGIPMLFILGGAIFTDRERIHVPPEMILIVIIAFLVAFIGRTMSGESNHVVMMIASILTGINLGVLGIIAVFILMRSVPAMEDDRRIVSFASVCIALASYVMIRILQYWIQGALDDRIGFDLDILMRDMTGIFAGAFFVAMIYDIRKRANIFGGMINAFLEENSDLIGATDAQKAEVQRLIEGGESEWLEFKSTMRTNLQTGEVDKRMEKAVLKTIVAFLNTEGGNLLIGVADDGSIIGADVQSFDWSRDKMGLHLGNLISSQIGESFLPYISFVMLDFDGKTVVRVKCSPCDKPVFLKEGKTETFFVRKGPQSDDLTGMSLISYVNNRKKQLRKL